MRNILIWIFNLLSALFSYLIPKQKGKLIFIPLHNKKKFSGNIKALILYAKNTYPELDISLINYNQSVISIAEEQGIHTISSYFPALWNSLRAEHIVIDGNTVLFRYGKFSIVQLWHGVGFKNVGLLNPHSALSEKQQKKHYDKYDLVVASSKVDAEKSEASFQTHHSVITGLPRTDLLFQDKEAIRKLKKKYKVLKYDKVVTYTPTFRDFKTKVPFTQAFWKVLNQFLKSENMLFLVNKHPFEKQLIVPKQYSNIKDYTKVVTDSQDLLLITDLLISDYSSIITDFVITGKPIIIYGYDYELYQEKCRSLFYDLEEVLPQPFIQEENELLERLKDWSWFQKDAIKKSYTRFKNKFHRYADNHSCERVMEEILKL